MKNLPTLRQSIEISPEEVKFWKAEIRSSLKRQKDEFITRVGYEELIRYFEALQVVEGAQINQMAILDEFSPGIISIITSTYNRLPSVIVKPAHPDADDTVRPGLLYLLQHPEFVPFSLSDLVTASLKYGGKKVGMKEEMQLADFDLLVAGFACVEMNHLSESPNQATANTDYPDQLSDNPILEKITGGIKSVYDNIKKTLTADEVEEDVASKVQNEKVDFTDSTYCKRWNPLDILFDSKAIVFKDSRFIAKVVRISVAEFNVMFPKHKGKISASSALVNEMPYQSHLNSEHKKAVTLYQLEIKKKGERNCVLIIADGIENEVDYFEDPIITNGFKIKYQCLDKYGKIYPMSRAKKAKKPQDDINHYLTIQFEHVDRAMRKIAVYIQGLTEAGKSAQKNSDVYGIVEKNTPQPVYEAMPAPQVVPENKEIVALMKDSINQLLQTSKLAKSGESDNELATQDLLENQTFQTNASAVSDALQDLSDELYDTLKDIQMQVWDGDDYFKVTGIDGAEQWYTPEMGPLSDLLVGDYEITSDITTAQKPNPLKDKQEAIEYATFITSPQTIGFCAMHGKRPSMMALNNVVKQFNQNPETAFEDVQIPIAGPGGIEQPPMPEEGPDEPINEDRAPSNIRVPRGIQNVSGI